MIADDTAGIKRPRGIRRRTFLGLAAAGFLAGCAPARGSAATTPAPTPSPAPFPPAGPIAADNARRLAQLGVFQPNDGRIRGAAWSPDGRVLAVGGARDIHVWDIAAGKPPARWTGHSDQIYGMSWCAANGMLASASDDGTVRLWQPGGTAAAMVLTYPSFAPVSVAWSPDGTMLAAGTFDGYVALWDAQTGKRLAMWSGPPQDTSSRGSRYPFGVYGLAWSPDARHIVSLRYDTKLVIWDVQAGKYVAVRKTDSKPNGVIWPVSGRYIASTSDAGTIQLWDPVTYKHVATMGDHAEAGWAYPVVPSPDAGTLAIGREDGTMQVWDVRAKADLTTHHKDSDAIWGLTWSPDGLRLASGSDDGTVRLWGVR